MCYPGFQLVFEGGIFAVTLHNKGLLVFSNELNLVHKELFTYCFGLQINIAIFRSTLYGNANSILSVYFLCAILFYTSGY